MINLNNGKEINTINGTKNIVLPAWSEIPDDLTPYFNKINSLSEKEMTFEELLSELTKLFWKEEIITNSGRFAICLWWIDTQIHRKVDNIVLPDKGLPVQNNMWGNVIDPIWWASRVVTPSEDYWLFWKVPELRPGSDKFDEKLFKELMRKPMTLSKILWSAVEVSEKETAFMPVYRIEWWEEIITPFSEKREPEDIPTAKHSIINNNY